MKRRVSLAMALMLSAGLALSACGGSSTTATTQAAKAAATTTAAAKAATTAAATTKAAAATTKAAAAATTAAKGAASSGKYDNTYNVAGAGNVTLNVMITSLGDSDGGPFLRKVMDNYMKLYPNVKLVPVECSMNDLYKTLITQATAGTLPDIFTMSEAYSANCEEMGMSVDNLDTLLGKDYMAQLLDVAVKNSTVKGKLIYMPWQNNTTAMVYRKDLFEKNGIQIPKTWDDFKAVAKKLTEDTNGDGTPDRYGAAFCGTRNDSAESRFQTFALTYGCDFLKVKSDGSFESGFNTDQFKKAMKAYIDMAANDGITPPGFVETGYSEAYTMIAADKACMFFSGSNVLGGIYNANPDMKGKMGSFPMPTDTGVNPTTSFSSVGMTISKTCKNPEVAADFLKYMTSVDNSLDWNAATCRLPVVKDALNAIVAKDEAYKGFAEASNSAVIYPAFAGTAELRDACGECWQSAVSQGISADDAIATAISKADAVVKAKGK